MSYKVLVDSNSYFRLARDIHPLLGRPFGDPAYTLYVIKELDDEFAKSQRLLSKFYWVSDERYQANRAACNLGGNVDSFDLKQTVKFMKDHKYNRGLGVSKIDIAVLATAYLLNIVIVTDDSDVQEMAKDYDMVECMTSLDVLGWLNSEGILTIQAVKATVKMWKYEKDLPMAESKFIEKFFEAFSVLPW